jgi:two-component system cell cycle response regulator DivK
VRILIVEDDDSSLDLAKRLVEDMGHTVLTASDGTKGLAFARSEKPDLLLLDLRMPGIDGLQVVREIRADPTLRTLPVIAVSADIADDGRAAAMAAGCDDFVAKPYDPEELRAAIRRRSPG